MPTEMTVYGNTIAKLQTMLKDKYSPYIRSMVRKDHLLLDFFKRKKAELVTLGGKQFLVPIEWTNSQGFAYGTERGALPDAGASTFEQATLSPALLHARIQFTNLAMKQAKKNPLVLVDCVEDQKKVIEQTYRREDYVIAGDGTGSLATVSADGTDRTVLTCDYSGDKRGVDLFEEGMRIEVFDISTGTEYTEDKTEITAVDPVNKTITISPALSFVPSWDGTKHKIFIEGEAYWGGAAMVYLVADGLRKMVDDDNTYMNINRATAANRRWRSIIKHNSGVARDFSIMDVDSCLRQVQRNGGKTDILISRDEVQRAFISSNLSSDNRQDWKDLNVSAGWNGLSNENEWTAIAYKWNGKTIPWFACSSFEPSVLQGLDLDYMGILEVDEADWADEDGNIIHRVEGYPVWDGYWSWYHNYFCNKPNCQFEIRDLNELAL